MLKVYPVILDYGQQTTDESDLFIQCVLVDRDNREVFVPGDTGDYPLVCRIVFCRDDSSLILRLVGVPDIDRDTSKAYRIDRVFMQH